MREASLQLGFPAVHDGQYTVFLDHGTILLSMNLSVLDHFHCTRLGCLKGGVDDILSHPWFGDIDFAALLEGCDPAQMDSGFSYMGTLLKHSLPLNTCCEFILRFTQEAIGAMGATLLRRRRHTKLRRIRSVTGAFVPVLQS